MNLYPDVKFSNNLIENEICNVTYSGFLFKNNSESVSIVYGFDEQWNNTTHQEMKKTDNGFIAEIKMQNFNNFNFCFKNSNDEWDNNNYQNYTAPISKKDFEPAFIINENVINNILDNIFEYDISTIETKSEENLNQETIVESIVEEVITQNVPTEENEIQVISEESTINEVTQQVIHSENIVENISNQTVSTEENSNSPTTIEAFEVTVESSEPINIEESIGSIVEEVSLDNEINQVFNDFYETDLEKNNVQTIKPIPSESQDFNMDSLIDEILAPITESTTFNNQSYIITSESPIGDFDFSDKTEDLEEDIKVDNLIDDLITDLYETVSTENTINSVENISKPEYDFISTEANTSISENIQAETIDDTIIDNEITDDFSEKIIEDLQVSTPVENTSVETFSDISTETTEDFTDESANEENTIENIIENPFEDLLEDSLLAELENGTESYEDTSTNQLEINQETLSGNTTTALVEIDNLGNYIVSPRSLSKFYKFKKKVKLAFYKILSLPKMLFNFGKQNG